MKPNSTLLVVCLLIFSPFIGTHTLSSQALDIQKWDIFPFQEQHVHGSSLVELPNGELLCVWFQGSGERWADDVVLNGSRWNAGSSSWSEPFVMADYPGFPDINPVLFMDPQKRLWLIWYTVLANQWETAILKYRISEDYLDPGPPNWSWQEVIHPKPGAKTERGIQASDPFVLALERKIPTYFQYLDSMGTFQSLPHQGYEWKEQYMERAGELLAQANGEDLMARGYEWTVDSQRIEKPLGYPRFRRMGWQTRNKPFILSSGRMLLPLYSDGFDFSLIAYTDDWGKHWNYSEPIYGLGPVQPTLLQRKDGSLVAYMRDNGPPPQRLMYSTSPDSGKTWTLAYDSELPNSGSAADAIQTQDGKWILVHNNTEEGRHKLALSQSSDEGKTWSLLGYIEKGEEGGPRAHYPAIIQSETGDLHISYSYHREGVDGSPQKTVRHAWVQLP